MVVLLTFLLLLASLVVIPLHLSAQKLHKNCWKGFIACVSSSGPSISDYVLATVACGEALEECENAYR